ncbi:hypothetical protein EDD29_7531 [Actinocorallia herbida]|uniref:DUF1349 domain-containing protein n=1 Tax=Actinocorallia herbida TaxID=58109 RepID=A0A3N1D8G2_9ACTN|nr:hypothetical protein [Actinocorallia herbida]ROO89822.1 hypothetical protein EDD29_7531 [Actinocorallia herbida]
MPPTPLHAAFSEFFRTRRYVVALVCALALTAFVGPFLAWTDRSTCSEGTVETPCPQAPRTPDGRSVTDAFTFAHRTLHGDGSMTARLSSFTGTITYPPPRHDRIVSGLVPWAKAGLLVKASLEPGAPYAAVMLTGNHGVRFQHSFTADEPGSPSPAELPRWLRLTRSGDLLTAEESPDGRTWHPVGSARLPGLPDDVPIGLFTTSPGDLTVVPRSFGPATTQVRFTQAVGLFDSVTTSGDLTRTWTATQVGGAGAVTDWERRTNPPGLVESPAALKVSGSGDIAPTPTEAGRRLESLLTGALPALLVLIGAAAAFTSRPAPSPAEPPARSEGSPTARPAASGVSLEGPFPAMTPESLAPAGHAPARPGGIAPGGSPAAHAGGTGTGAVRARLRARAAVLGAVGAAVGLLGGAAAVWAGPGIARGTAMVAVPVGTEARVVVGCAMVCAAAAVLAGCLAVLLGGGWRGAAAGAALLPLPYALATTGVLPAGAASWLLRVTPAAGMAAQQSLPPYPQVTALYSPANGYLPLAPWAGLAVLLAFTGLALGLALRAARRGASGAA